MIVHYARQLVTNRNYLLQLAVLVIVGDAFLTALIVRFVRYTEIDWETYMIHIQLYLKGERDYSFITGPTGPLVYPAGHVYVHRVLYVLTNSGQDIPFAQRIYAALYVISLILSVSIYVKAGNLPNWVLFFLPLSKRLHSIYALRLFNDCWSVVAVQASVLAFQHGMDDLGTALFSIALSIKMSVLLYIPGLLVIFFLRGGLWSTIRRLLTIVSIQVILAYPFLKQNTSAYLHLAFDFSRVFMYKWTVNWRMVSEQTFLNPLWAKSLLTGHVIVLIFFGSFRWLSGQGGLFSVLSRGFRRPNLPATWVTISPDYVATILYTSNLIGVLFARSLHYQFYSWYAQQLPFLAWRTRYPLFVKFILLLATEYAWNVFPATPLSSGVLLTTNALLLLGLWFGYCEGKDVTKTAKTL